MVHVGADCFTGATEAWGGAGRCTSGLADTYIADESKLAEILNVAWAAHEFTSLYAKQTHLTPSSLQPTPLLNSS